MSSSSSAPPPPPVPSPPTVPAPAPVFPDPAAAVPQRSVSKVSATTVTRVIGYGLVAMFLLDLPAVIVAYAQNPFDPLMDGVLVSQILDRIAFPLIGFGLIFGFEARDLVRFERIVRKLLSHAMLFASLFCLGLAVLTVSSAIRQYNHAAILVDFRTNQRVTALTQLGKEVNTLVGNPLRTTYTAVVHPDKARPVPGPDQMRKEIAAAVPGELDAAYAAARTAKSQGKRTELVAMVKFALDGLISAVLFFALWEGSYTARLYRIFRPKDAPGLGVEAAVIGGVGRVARKIESIRIFPNWEDFAWFRRIRRKLRHRRDRRQG